MKLFFSQARWIEDEDNHCGKKESIDCCCSNDKSENKQKWQKSQTTNNEKMFYEKSKHKMSRKRFEFDLEIYLRISKLSRQYPKSAQPDIRKAMLNAIGPKQKKITVRRQNITTSFWNGFW